MLTSFFMNTILDILVYVIFAYIASFLANKSRLYVKEYNIKENSWDQYLIWFVLFFAIIGGIRWNVGSDCLSYAHQFTYKSEYKQEKERLWWAFSDYIRIRRIHWTIGLGICAFIQIFFITKTLQRYRWLLVFVPFVMFGGRYWLDCMGAVRQMIVACGFLWASKFIYEKKPIQYFLFILIASLIHQSALILIPMYFIPSNFNIENKRIILLLILAACILIGQAPSYSSSFQYLEKLMDVTNYDNYNGKIKFILNQDQTDEALNFGPMMLSYVLIPGFIIWFGPTLKKKYAEKIPYFDLWYNFAYFYACGYFLICNLSHLFIRPMLYFSLFQMIMASLLLYDLWNTYKRKHLGLGVLITYCIIIGINTTWDTIKASGKQWEITTYKIYWFHKDQASKYKL